MKRAFSPHRLLDPFAWTDGSDLKQAFGAEYLNIVASAPKAPDHISLGRRPRKNDDDFGQG
ncbi:MAG: hypothetical protein KF886_25130 [Candidatus Hydrogenedentes bacterium]|nr:hypothetical protein [Candidatus Hydrogenedentota bacterium]